MAKKFQFDFVMRARSSFSLHEFEGNAVVETLRNSDNQWDAEESVVAWAVSNHYVIHELRLATVSSLASPTANPKVQSKLNQRLFSCPVQADHGPPTAVQITCICGFSRTIPDFANGRIPFATVYRDVTAALLRSVVKESVTDKNWFNYLIASFNDRFDEWEDSPPRQIRYLQIVQEKAEALYLFDKLFRFLGHAYLHIHFDLPRSIADSLSGTTILDTPSPSNGRKIDFRQRVIASPKDLNQAATLFHSQAKVFSEVMEGTIGDKAVVGSFPALLRFVPKRYNPIPLVANWVIALRQLAWHHAVILHCSTAAERCVHEKALLEAALAAIEHAAKESGTIRWIDRFGVTPLNGIVLDASTVALLVALIFDSPERDLMMFSILSALVTRFIYVFCSVEYEYFRRFGDTLQRNLRDYSERALRGERFTTPSEE